MNHHAVAASMHHHSIKRDSLLPNKTLLQPNSPFAERQILQRMGAAETSSPVHGESLVFDEVGWCQVWSSVNILKRGTERNCYREERKRSTERQSKCFWRLQLPVSKSPSVRTRAWNILPAKWEENSSVVALLCSFGTFVFWLKSQTGSFITSRQGEVVQAEHTK